ncbi:hypothetical protein EDB19DRAFT_1913000 [Suillus lakei]|nr:hypothetical protein EDB19DRAFT_1913000 [Suillus lakei]
MLTPPHTRHLPVTLPCPAEVGLKSTPHAVGSAVVSEHISTVGVEVADVRPWIMRDVQNFEKCEADTMLQELLAGCTGPSQSLSASEKSTLLQNSLKAVMPICNEGAVAQEIKDHLTNLAANCALRELSELKIHGIPAFKDEDKTNILFHVNDTMPIYQDHQGRQSERKPDVVVVSHQTALGANKQKSQDVTEIACKPPKDNFQWTDVRSTLEVKRPRKHLPHPPSAYKIDYVVPTPSVQYMKFVKDADAKPAGSTPPTGSAQHPPLKHRMNLRRSNKVEESSAKRAGNNENQTENKEPKTTHPVVQNGLYVAEMFAAHIARLHVISFIVNNDYIYVWFSDRENVVQSAAINFVQDLPRFLVLLLVMQRMRYDQWGLNPVFEPVPGFSGEVMIEDTQIDLELDLKSDECITHFGIRGRATTVFPVKSKALSGLRRDPGFLNESPELVGKLYWPEETRQSEPDILDEVYKIAQADPDVQGHVPELVWSYKFEGTSTSRIRIALGLKDVEQAKQGSRVLYILVFRKLIPLSDAFRQGVPCCMVANCKAIAPSGREACFTGMLALAISWDTVYAVNSLAFSTTTTYRRFNEIVPSSLERTGTVPFMAVDLLTLEAIQGKVEHVYAHDAESFIWVLTWVCLRYEDGNLLSQNRPLDEWLKVDAIQCREKKNDFRSSGLPTMRPSGSHEVSWGVVHKCFMGLYSLYTPSGYRTLDDQSAFELLLEVPMQGHL